MSTTATCFKSSSSATLVTFNASEQVECRTSLAEVCDEPTVDETADTEDPCESGGLCEDISGAFETGTVLRGQTVAHDPTHRTQPSLSSIPLEVKLNILSFIDDDSDGLYTKACLALTCSKMYQAYKLIHPDPIAWTVGPALIDAKGHKWEYALQHHIGVFLGPGYRRHRFDPRFIFPFKKWPAFLSREVYGAMYNMKEIELNNRYSDWGGLPDEQKPKLCKLVKSLPSPFGLGEEWDGLALKALQKLHMNGYDDGRSKSTGLRGPPKYLFVYKKMMRDYEEFYDAFAEWIVMAGA